MILGASPGGTSALLFIFISMWQKKFVHKTLLRIAEPSEDNYKWEKLYCIYQEIWGKYIKQTWWYKYNQKELIELWFQEEVQVDWIDKCVVDICQYQSSRPWDLPDYVEIRNIIEKHVPKQKMFTIKYMRERSKKHQWINTQNLEEFLQEHWLLSEDIQWIQNP